MQTGASKKRPCDTCQRVRDPANCENKLCRDWQTWFIDRWESMRRAVAAQAHGKGIQGDPISVGGVQYHHPDHVRAYLENDPCQQCPFGGGLCREDCATKQAWLEAKGAK